MNLVNIEDKYLTLDAMIEETQGEITPEIERYMQEIDAYAVGKVFDLAGYYGELNSFAKLCKDEAARYAAKAKSLELRAEFFKRMIIRVMEISGQKTMDSGLHKITIYQAPLKIEVRDVDMVPKAYKNVSLKLSWQDYEKIKDMVDADNADVAADKKKIAELYKSNEIEVDGVSYSRSTAVRIS